MVGDNILGFWLLSFDREEELRDEECWLYELKKKMALILVLGFG